MNFKVGDKVRFWRSDNNKPTLVPATITRIETNRIIVYVYDFDCYGQNERWDFTNFDLLIPEIIFISPLYQALQEE